MQSMAARRLSSLLSSSLSTSPFRSSLLGGVSRQERFIMQTSIIPNSASGKTFPTFDPRTGDVITHVAEGDAEDINRAVASARKAFDEGPWPRMMTAYERSRILFKFADLVEKHKVELASLETWDNGKPYKQALNVEIPLCTRIIRYYAVEKRSKWWADKIHGLTASGDGPYQINASLARADRCCRDDNSMEFPSNLVHMESHRPSVGVW